MPSTKNFVSSFPILLPLFSFVQCFYKGFSIMLIVVETVGIFALFLSLVRILLGVPQLNKMLALELMYVCITPLRKYPSIFIFSMVLF